MDWKQHVMERTISPGEAAGLVKSGHRVVTAHACAEPQTLVRALVQRAPELRDVEIVHMVAMGESPYCRPEYASSFRHNALFVGANTRQAVTDGRADFTPCFFHQIPTLFRDGTLPVDVAMITVSEPDETGAVSLGVSVDYTMEAAHSARTVIAEIQPQMPRTGPRSCLPALEIDYFVNSLLPLHELNPPEIGDVERSIGGHIAGLIRDGDCLQLGIGAIPDAVLGFLDGKRDLGIHTEMISDGVMRLAERGIINGKKKQIHPGKIVITFAMGTAGFYRWLDGNPMIDAYPVDYTNDPSIIAQNDNMVSINSAITVDLLGQVAADAIGPRQYSGVGGQVDFVRGAAHSRGGRSIIALPATAKGGTVSRVTAAFERGQAVTTSRNDVDYVVTEYGAAHLRGKTMRRRAEALIAVAAPRFRDGLARECRELYRWY